MLPRVPKMVEMTVMGRINGRHLGKNSLREWVNFSWARKVDSFPTIQTLSNGWFMFRFQSQVNTTNILNVPWCFNSSSMLVKRWSPLFNVSHKRIDELPIWVFFPRLTVDLWTPKDSEYLGNELGRYMDANMSFKGSRKMSMARILVTMNIHKGLEEEI